MLIRKIEKFLRRTGMSATKFGRLAARELYGQILRGSVTRLRAACNSAVAPSTRSASAMAKAGASLSSSGAIRQRAVRISCNRWVMVVSLEAAATVDDGSVEMTMRTRHGGDGHER